MSRLSRSRSVCRLTGLPSEKSKTFVSDREGGDGKMVTIMNQTWADLGNPEEITLTIEPGNTLEEK